MTISDFDVIANNECIDTRYVQEFLDSFDSLVWEEIDEDNRHDIERARQLKELVTGESVTDQQFESECIILIRENAYTEYVKDEYMELWPSISELPPEIRGAIDWEEVASDYRCDYAEIEWEGNTYLFDLGRLG